MHRGAGGGYLLEKPGQIVGRDRRSPLTRRRRPTGTPTVSAIVYGVSKAAVSLLTVQYARAAPEIKVNAVEPGYTATELGGQSNSQGRPVEISGRVSMATTVKPQVVTVWWARAISAGVFLCWPPP
jgi:NAD(P)-dependent dehydrogenase (short-subunit alcohol dehydrogenase family)